MTKIKDNFFNISGRIFSFLIFITGLFFLKWSAAYLLIGFWIEEVLIFIFTSIENAILRFKNPEEKKKASTGRFAYIFFIFFHLVFIIIFLFIASPKDPDIKPLLNLIIGIVFQKHFYIERSVYLALLEISGSFFLWNIIDLLQTNFIGKNANKITVEDIDNKTKASLLLPHMTIIGGGFALIVLKSVNWLSIGLIAGKFCVELFLFAVTGKTKKAEVES